MTEAPPGASANPRASTGADHTSGGVIVRRALAAIVGVAFVFVSAGLVGAQTPPPATKMDDKKMEDKKDTSMKKAPHHTAVGTVKTAGPDNLVVAGKSKGKDTEWTFALNDKTKVKKAGKDVTAKDIAEGDKVTVRNMDEAGKMTAMSVSASAPKQAVKAKEEPVKK